MADADGLTFARLGDVGELLMGNSPPGETYNDRGEGLPLINGPAEYGPRHPRPVKWTTAPSRICKPGDILVCVRGNTTGRLCVADGEYCIGRGVAALRGKEKTYLTPFLEFVMRFHQDKILEKAAGGGSTFPNINKPQLEELEVPLPPLEEQQAIAHVLRTVQQAKEATEKVIAAAQQLKQSLMRHLFTYGPVPVDQAEQVTLKETEAGSLPEHWNVVRLGEIARIERGKFMYRPRNEPRFYGGSVPFIQTGDVAKSGGRITRHSQTLNELGLSISRLFPKGTIVITIAANIGDTAILEYDCAFPDSLIGIAPCDQVDPVFLELYLRTQKDEMNRLAPRGTQKNINIQFLQPWPVLLPPFEEQREIARTLRAVDRKIEREATREQALEALFKTLLHHLMTGKARVNGLDLPPTTEVAP